MLAHSYIIISSWLQSCNVFSSYSTDDIQPQTYEEVPDITKPNPVYEEIGLRDRGVTKLAASNNPFSQEYAEIMTMEEVKEYEFTECVAYGLHM